MYDRVLQEAVVLKNTGRVEFEYSVFGAEGGAGPPPPGQVTVHPTMVRVGVWLWEVGVWLWEVGVGGLVRGGSVAVGGGRWECEGLWEVGVWLWE